MLIEEFDFTLPLNHFEKDKFSDEYIKMINGEPYTPKDLFLTQQRAIRRRLQYVFNNCDCESEIYQQAMNELLGSCGENTWIEAPYYTDYGRNTFLGKYVYINANCTILDVARVNIGDYTMIGPDVGIYTATHPIEYHERCVDYKEFGYEINIGNGVWIGGNSVILPGITIGDKSVIAAGSVVTRDVPENVVVAGNPARIIKYIDNN